MRASVRLVLGALAALLVAVVWFGRNGQELPESDKDLPDSMVNATSAQVSNASRIQAAQIVDHPDSEREKKITPEGP